MWNVKIIDKGINNEVIEIQAEFSNGTESIKRNFAGNTKEEIDRRIKRQLDALIARDENYTQVSTGDWTPPAEEPAPEKTADELAQEAWLAEWNKYVAAKKGMDALAEAGVTPTQEETDRFEALKTWVAENRKPEYTYLIANN